ncbi:MAG: adenylate kinase family protein [Acidobacteriaceae bacterium]
MKLHTAIVLLGPPGSGKGTQGITLAKKLKYGYFSMGEVLRQVAAKPGDPVAKRINQIMNRGLIIPKSLIAGIFRDTIKKYLSQPGVIIDGFPREVSQISIFDKTCKEHDIGDVKVLFLDVSRKSLLERIKKRKTIEVRTDDDPKVVSSRFLEYRRKTLPIVKLFKKRKLLITIDGDKTVAGVFKEIIQRLKNEA